MKNKAVRWLTVCVILILLTVGYFIYVHPFVKDMWEAGMRQDAVIS